MAFQNRVDVDKKRNLLDRMRGRSPATQGTSFTPPRGRPAPAQPGFAQTAAQTENIFGDLTPEAQAQIIEERDLYAEGTIGEPFAGSVREAQEIQPTGLMANVADAINWAMPALELSSGMDHFLGTDVRGFKQNQTEKSIVHAFTAEVIDGALSPISLAEIGLTLFTGGKAGMGAAMSAGTRILAKPLIKAGARGAYRGLITAAPKAKVKTAVREAAEKALTPIAKERAALQVMFPKLPTTQVDKALKIASRMLLADVPQTIAERGAMGTGAFLLARNGSIDAGAYAAGETAVELGLPPQVQIAAMLIGGGGGYFGATQAATKALSPRIALTATGIPENEIPDIVLSINEVYAKSVYPEGFPTKSSREAGKGKRRDRDIKTPSILEVRVIGDTLAGNPIQLTRTRGTPEEVLTGRGEVVPFEGSGAYYKDDTYFIDPVTQERIIDPGTGLPRTQKDMVLGGRPFSKSFVDIRINDDLLRDEWNALPEHGAGNLRPSYNPAEDQLLTPGKTFFSETTQSKDFVDKMSVVERWRGNEYDSRYYDYKEYRKLQELVKAMPELFGGGNLDITNVEVLKRLTDNNWGNITGRGITYSTSRGNFYTPVAVQELVKEFGDKLPNKSVEEMLDFVLGEQTFFGVGESLNTQMWTTKSSIEQQFLETYRVNEEVLLKYFTPLKEKNTNQYVFRLIDHPSVSISRYDLYRNPTKYIRALREAGMESSEVQEVLDAVMAIATVNDDVRKLIEQAGGGFSKYRTEAELAGASRLAYEAKYPNGNGMEKFDSTLNMNYIPEYIEDLPEALGPIGDDGARFLASHDTQPRRDKWLTEEDAYSIRSGNYAVWPTDPSKATKYYDIDAPIVVDEATGVVLDTPYRSTDDISAFPGVHIQSPEDSIKAYIHDGLDVWYQRHMYNEVLSLADVDSAIARKVYETLNFGESASNLEAPYQYSSLINEATPADELTNTIGEMLIRTRGAVQRKTNEDLGAITKGIKKYNAIQVFAGTALDLGTILTLGSKAILYNSMQFGPNYMKRNIQPLKAFWAGIQELNPYKTDAAAKAHFDNFIQEERTLAALDRGAPVYDYRPDTLEKELATGPIPDWLFNAFKYGGRGVAARFQSGFTRTLNELRINGAQNEIDLFELKTGRKLTPTERFNIQQGWNRITGAPADLPNQLKRVPEKVMGIRTPLKGFSTNDFSFAAGFFRSQLQTYNAALRGHGPEALVARRAIRNLAGTATTMAFLSNLALQKTGQGSIDPFESVNPIDFDALRQGEYRVNKNWLTIGIGNTELDLGFGLKPLLGLLTETPINAAIRTEASDINWGLLKAIDKAISDAITRKGSPALRTIYDFVSGGGYDFNGRQMLPFRRDIDYNTSDDATQEAGLGGISWQFDERVVPGDDFSKDPYLDMFISWTGRFNTIWGQQGIEAADEYADYLDAAHGAQFPMGDVPQERMKRWANIGMHAGAHMGVEFFGGKIRFSSPKERIEQLFLLDREINNSITPAQYKDAMPHQIRAMEMKYPQYYELLEESYSAEKGTPSRKQQGYIAIQQAQIQTNNEIMRLLGFDPDERERILSGVTTIEDGRKVDALDKSIKIEKVYQDVSRIMAKGYEERQTIRENYGMLLNQSSNGRKVQNAVRVAYENAKEGSEWNYDLLDMNLARIERDILAGSDLYGTTGDGSKEDRQAIYDNLMVLRDTAPPDTGIIVVDNMINDKRILSKAGWWDFYDEGIKLYGRNYYSWYGQPNESIQTYNQLTKEIGLLDNQMRDINRKAREQNVIPDPNLLKRLDNRRLAAQRLRNKVDTFAENRRKALMAKGDTIIAVDISDVLVGPKEITGTMLKNAVYDLGKQIPK